MQKLIYFVEGKVVNISNPRESNNGEYIFRSVYIEVGYMNEYGFPSKEILKITRNEFKKGHIGWPTEVGNLKEGDKVRICYKITSGKKLEDREWVDNWYDNKVTGEKEISNTLRPLKFKGDNYLLPKKKEELEGFVWYEIIDDQDKFYADPEPAPDQDEPETLNEENDDLPFN